MSPPGTRTVIVTGASSGIGREVALAAARQGYAVVAVGRRRDRLSALEADIAAAGGLATAVAADVRHKESPQVIVDAALQHYGRIDVIVHAAGLAAAGDLSTQSDAANTEQLETHVIGPLALTRTALPSLLQSAGQIYFVGSGVARLPITGLGAYPPAKAAIRSAAMIMRRELRDRGVSVTYVDPGAVATEFMHRAGMMGPPPSVLLAPDAVAAKIVRAFARRPATVSGSLMQTASVALGALFPALTAAVLDIFPDMVGTQRIATSASHGEPVATSHGEPLATSHGEPVATSHGEPEATSHGEPVEPRPSIGEASSYSAALRQAQDDTAASLDQVLEPLRARMAKFSMRESIVTDALAKDERIALGELAMRWAGMPNKHERALTSDVLSTLAAAGFLEPEGEDVWRIVRRP